MGNDQSRGDGTRDGTEENSRPLDYYALLEVDEEATFEDIKRSYRKLALLNHPDKNPHRIDEATKLFSDLQQAYEILSDPHERAFYDSHRNVAVPTTDDDLYEHVRAGHEASDTRAKLNRRRRGDPGLTLEQLMRFFDPKLARRLDDTNEGFFSVYRTLFALLASDEALHTDNPMTYPSFGCSTDQYAPEPGCSRAQRDAGTWARDFYVVWSEFTTEKRFDWVAKWDLERGSDRQMKRLMEKENKKIREDYRKEYNEAVRQLALFLQHRDPRYKAHRAHLRSARHTSQPKPTVPARKTDASGSVNYAEQDWQRLQSSSESSEDDEEEEEGGGVGVRVTNAQGGEVLECVACSKSFLSEASWENHERSKKHKQALWRLKKEMQLEDAALDLSEPVSGTVTPEILEGLEGLEISELKLNKKPTSSPKSVDTAPEPPSEISKREKRRAREAKKKEEQEAEKLATKAAKKLAKGGGAPRDTSAQQEAKLNRKADGVKPNPKPKRTPPLVAEADVFSEHKVNAAVANVSEKRTKMKEKWGESWTGILSSIRPVLEPGVRILCLGLGKPFTDRTAQIQLALMLELAEALHAIAIEAFDPVWDEGDLKVIQTFQIQVIDNKMGSYPLLDDSPYLLYLPHCARALYESLLASNFGPRFAGHPGRLLLGNDLAEYIGLVRLEPTEPQVDAFEKPKKKRKGKGQMRPVKDGVLERLVPHMSVIPLSGLPDTNLPGFARAFLSLAFQWLPEEKACLVDFATELPPVVWPEDGELLA